MYLDFFGFRKNPFQMAPDEEYLYMSKQHAKALVYMDYSSWRPGGFVVITGEIGSGKTTLAKWILKNISGKANCLHISFTNLENNDLYLSLLKQLDAVPNRSDKIHLIYALQERLEALNKEGKPCVLIIDEAQNLTSDQLEDIRMLSALEGRDGQPLLRITLLAQPEFVHMIRASEQFRQRVKLHYHLKGLSKDDVKSYIEYRIGKSGIDEQSIFGEEVVDEIFSLSKGIPRIINKLCDGLLMCAYAEERKTVIKEDLEDILSDLMIEVPGVTSKEKETSCVSDKSKDDNVSVLIEAINQLNGSIEKLAGVLAK